MSNINFVPDDYVQGNESRRANLMCLVLFSVVMAVLGGFWGNPLFPGALHERLPLLLQFFGRQCQNGIVKSSNLIF